MSIAESIALGLVLLLALYGCIQAAVRISMWALTPKKQRVQLLLPLSGNTENAEQHIRAVQLLRQQLMKNGEAPSFVVLDTGMDEQTRQITALLLRNYGGELLDMAAWETWVLSCSTEPERV